MFQSPVSESEDEDEWLFQSIKRYEHLKMFDLENTVKHLKVSDEDHLCIIGKYNLNQDEILELALPKKLTVESSSAGFVKDVDMRVERGGFSGSSVFKMQVLYNKHVIITSEKGQNGINLYHLGSVESDLISSSCNIHCGMKAPRFSVNFRDNAILCGMAKDNVSVMDISANKLIQQFSISSENDVFVEPVFVDNFTVALCEIQSSDTHIYDLRSDVHIKKFTGIPVTCFKNRACTISSSFGFNHPEESAVNCILGFVSSDALFATYDFRNLHCPLWPAISLDTEIETKEKKTPSLSFSENKSMIAVSGIDCNVYVYDLVSSGKLNKNFVHDGHKKFNKCELTVAHAWWKNDYLISSCDQNSVHCWKFNR